MDIYISDIKNDNNHPRSTGIGELGNEIEKTFPEKYYERANLERLLIVMLGEIRSLRKRVKNLENYNKTQ